MNQQELQKMLGEFEQHRGQLANVSQQKQTMQFQLDALSKASEELKKTKEEKVYKAVGNILILSPAKEVAEEVNAQIESVEVRLKTMQKQEDTLVDSMNKMKAEIEEGMKALQPEAPGVPAGEEKK